MIVKFMFNNKSSFGLRGGGGYEHEVTDLVMTKQNTNIMYFEKSYS